MKQVLILGFYDRANLGDDMFKEIFPNLLPDFKPIFLSIDDFTGNLTPYSAVVCGGGDIYNEYFLEKLRLLRGASVPVYLVGVGIPFPSVLESGDLHLFDHVFVRNKTDLHLISRKIAPRYVHYLPDLGFLKSGQLSVRRGIGVFLTSSTPITSKLLSLLEEASQYGRLHFIRFNTSGTEEDDRFIYERLDTELAARGVIPLNDLTVYTVDEMLTRMGQFELNICGRFHAHVFSMISGTPFVSVAQTRKVELLLKDSQLSSLSLRETWERRKEISTYLFSISNENRFLLRTRQINQLLLRNDRRPKLDIDPETVYQSCRNFLGYDPEERREKIPEPIARKVAARLCFELTRTPGSKHEWGTVENLMERPWELRQMIDWIIKEQEAAPSLERLDLDYYDQGNLRGLHRAGWHYVLTYLRTLSSPKGVLCDTFIERSFIWGRWILNEMGILPYTSLWVGFAHHTPDTTHSDNNAEAIFQAPEFIQSLPTCRGIICLSERLSSWYRTQFEQLNVNVPVLTLKHPTLFIPKKWSSPPNLKLVNVGAWYRNPYTIHRLHVPSWIQKVSLKGHQMESYFRPDAFWLDRSAIDSPSPRENKWLYYFAERLQEFSDLSMVEVSSGRVEAGSYTDLIQTELDSVQIIESLNDGEYDALLTSSIIFLHLIDVSAANTVIEAIVRETPILVNRLPALEEYLGSEYPLFYDSLEEIEALLQPARIQETHEYLSQLDKNGLRIETFLSNLTESDLYQKLLID
jgi:hypothetical protein